jgi:hypothetical protein
MLVVIVQTAISVREIDDKISAVILLIGLFLWNFKFLFGSVFRIMNLE